jgi:hypothetical protein
VLAESGRLFHFAKDEQAYIASERFLLPETDSLLFLVISAREGQIVLQTAVSSYPQPFSRHCMLWGGPSLNRLSHCRLARFDVVIHSEEIRRIVFVFQGDQPVIVRAVGGPCEGVSFVRNVVYV